MKKCSNCKIEKNLTEFNKGKNWKDELQTRCKSCSRLSSKNWNIQNSEKRKEYGKAYRNTDKERAKSKDLSTKYGISFDQYKQMLAEQNNSCFICKRHESNFKKSLNVDHDHLTGKVRSLLCMSCNTALGNIKENFDIALNLAKYIQEHKGIV